MRALVTGHTGFAGRALSAVLGDVAGLSRSTGTDLLDRAAVAAAIEAASPDVVFHLAGQPISTAGAADSFAVNVMGTVHVLDAARAAGAAVVMASTGHVYADQPPEWGFREQDLLGAHTAYGAAKASAEIAGRAMRRSFGLRFAAARSPNVMGAGDDGEGRIVPELLDALSTGRPPSLKTPGAAQQWLHVDDLVTGYLAIAERLLADADCPDAFNLAPRDNVCTVAELARRFGFDVPSVPTTAPARRLDPTRAAQMLGWTAARDLDDAIANTLPRR
jgi:CDP-glucose 4,6-dehydratase